MHRLPAAIVLALLAQIACAQDAPAAADQTVAGTVSLIEGDARVLDRVLKSRRPAVGDPIYEGESIVTGANGEVHIDMQDGGYIGVRPGTKMQILDFKAEGGADDGFVLGLLQGSFRAVTGWITKGNRKSEVTTPTATIGIRGTDYEPLVIPEGGTGGEPGTYNRVNIGETEMRTAQGSVIVRPNQAGFVPYGSPGMRGAVAPRMLARVPDLFKATRNEKVFQGLHTRIQGGLGDLRTKRIQQIELRRKEAPKAGPAPKAAAQKTEAVQKSGAKAGAAKADAEKKPAETPFEKRKRERQEAEKERLKREEALKQKRLDAQKEQIKREQLRKEEALKQKQLQDARKEQIKREQLKREDALKQKRLQDAQKDQLRAQKQAEERKRRLQELEHAKAAKKAEKEERLKRRLEKHD